MISTVPGCLVLATAALVLGVVAQSPLTDGGIPAEFREANSDDRCGVFLVRILQSRQVKLPITAHFIEVEEVIKPFRTVGGAFLVPLEVHEKSMEPTLTPGRKYALVVRMTRGMYADVWLGGSSEIRTGEPAWLDEERRLARSSGVLGSGFIGDDDRLDSNDRGVVWTRHDDGFVDPEPFGFGVEDLKQVLTAGKRILVVLPHRYRGEFPIRPEECDLECEVLEDLATGAKPPARVWIRNVPREVRPSKGDGSLPFPYRRPYLAMHRLAVVTGEERDGLIHVESILPLIHRDDRTVLGMREGVEKAKIDLQRK